MRDTEANSLFSLEFPALTQAPRITVESTGDLDCAAFAANVVDVTVRFRATDEIKDSVTCSSNTGSIAMHLPMTLIMAEDLVSERIYCFWQSLLAVRACLFSCEEKHDQRAFSF